MSKARRVFCITSAKRFAPARARMRELVRKAARVHDGAEVDWAGDGVFLAFPRARDAVAAAAEMQRSLAAEPWPDEAPHRLRIGIHTGEPELGEEGYVGMDVVIAARICSTAHGEQVVVSRADARRRGRRSPFRERRFAHLGRHRLKDVPTAAELFQLVAPDLLRRLSAAQHALRHTLPALHHRLIGRAHALAQVEELLSRRPLESSRSRAPAAQGRADWRSRWRHAQRRSAPSTSSVWPRSRTQTSCRAR